MDFIGATQNSVHEVGLLVPRSSIVSVGRTPGEHEPCVCPAPAGRRPLIIGVEYCLAGSSPLKLDFIKNLKIGVDGGWWVGDRKTQDNQRVDRWLLARSTYLWGRDKNFDSWKKGDMTLSFC